MIDTTDLSLHAGHAEDSPEGIEAQEYLKVGVRAALDLPFQYNDDFQDRPPRGAVWVCTLRVLRLMNQGEITVSGLSRCSDAPTSCSQAREAA